MNSFDMLHAKLFTVLFTITSYHVMVTYLGMRNYIDRRIIFFDL